MRKKSRKKRRAAPTMESIIVVKSSDIMSVSLLPSYYLLRIFMFLIII